MQHQYVARVCVLALTIFSFSLGAKAQNYQKKITISGYITDTKSGETLIGAGVVSNRAGAKSSIPVGSVTNNYGFYTLTIPAGKTNLTYSYLGYAPQDFNLSLQKDTVINVRLNSDTQLKEAVIVARKESGINSTNMGAIEIPMQQMLSAPAIFGETDVLKTIQLMPGVQTGVEGTSGLYVRGGGPDENLMLLDGISLYNVDHMLGIFSVFTPEAVKKVTLYKGSFPARYGGRISSIIDVRTNDGNMKETHGVVSTGLLSSRLHLEGPINKDRTTYSISARGLHTILYEPLFRLFKVGGNYFFYDLNLKLTHRFSDKDRLFFSVYNGRDKLYTDIYDKDDETSFTPTSSQTRISRSTTKANINWGNTIGAIRWNHVFANQLFANTTIAYNHYSMDVITSYKEKITESNSTSANNYSFKYDSGIKDLSARIDFDYTPSPNHLIKFGCELIRHDFCPETSKIKQKEVQDGKPVTDTLYKQQSGNDIFGTEASSYIEDDMRIGDHLTINPGIHFSAFNTQGKTYYSLQPRFSTKLSFGEGYSIKAAYSRMAQYVHLLSSTSISLPTDLWVPITKDIKPVIGDQYSIGAYYDGLKGWEFSIEGYYKTMKNILEYKDGMSVMGSSANWEDKVDMGDGRAYGVEFFAQKTLGKTTGWIGYTLAKSDRIFKDGSINNGERFPYKYDRRHDISLCINQQFSKRVDLSATWVFATGGTATIAERQTVVTSPSGETDVVDYVSQRNNYRLPCSHRLNIGVNLHKQLKHGERIWNFSIYNAYNEMNPNFVYTDNDTVIDDNGSHMATKIEKITVLPFLPSFSYTFKF